MRHSRRGCCGHPDFRDSPAGEYVQNAQRTRGWLAGTVARMALGPSTPVAGVLNTGGFTARLAAAASSRLARSEILCSGTALQRFNSWVVSCSVCCMSSTSLCRIAKGFLPRRSERASLLPTELQPKLLLGACFGFPMLLLQRPAHWYAPGGLRDPEGQVCLGKGRDVQSILALHGVGSG